MLSRYLVKKMLLHNIISNNDVELYLFGLCIAMTIIQNLLITMAAGVLFGNILETLVFILAYIPLRSFAGGYHASTEKKCFSYSLFLVIISQVYFCCIQLYMYSFLKVFYFASIVTILLLAPVQSNNRLLSEKEKSSYTKIVRVIMLIECILLVSFRLSGLPRLSGGIEIALATEAILLILGGCDRNSECQKFD